MTYSIVARDPGTGEMGVACQSQAFAIGSSVPWALPGYGVVATQSMGEPMYGELGLDALRGGLTATEALAALRAVDPHPERRQVAMVDSYGAIDVYTGEACVEAAGHLLGDGFAVLANMVVGPSVWEAMAEAYEATEGAGQPGGLAWRLLAALRAAEAAGGDFRGRRSAALLVVRATRTGRPWRDQVVDLRVDAHPDPVAELDRLARFNDRYHQMVGAFESALDDRPADALEQLGAVGACDPGAEPDLCMWRAVVLARAGRLEEARAAVAALGQAAPQFLEAVRRFAPAGLIDPATLDTLLADSP